MSKLSRLNKQNTENKNSHADEVVVNFMGGESFKLSPLETLKMISASSIFGEPSYYRESGVNNDRHIQESKYTVDNLIKADSVMPSEYCGKTTKEIMEDAIDNALSYDFKGTLEWAATLRKEYYVRLNPQVILVRAAMHPDRKKFTSESVDGAFRKLASNCLVRADDALAGMSYYIYTYGSKNKIPSILKRAWADKLESLSAYEIAKYKNSELGMIDGVRICHACSLEISELMKTGKVEVDTNQKTWENLRSAGKSWKEIFETVKIGHMALLRNLRGFFSEVTDLNVCLEYCERLKSGVLKGKQFPYRYYSAYKSIEAVKNLEHKQLALDTLEECIDISINNMPRLKGRTVALSDNSGSAWYGVTTEYGVTRVAEINNLSAVIVAACSDEGYVVKFGTDTKVFPISKNAGILKQTNMICENEGEDVGLETEAGIWKFLNMAIEKKEHWDNILIYSDMQAGHGGLFGTGTTGKMILRSGYGDLSKDFYATVNINVFDMIKKYWNRVNPKVNTFSIQTAGYDNSVLPEYAYRTNLLYGWTGKEPMFASEMIKQWDEIDKRVSINN